MERYYDYIYKYILLLLIFREKIMSGNLGNPQIWE